MGFSEILEISKPRIVVLLVITAVTSMFAASKLIGPDLDYWGLLHIIIAGALASAGSSALNHYYDRDIDPLMKRTSTRPIPSGRIKPNSVTITSSPGLRNNRQVKSNIWSEPDPHRILFGFILK